jgi:hypothetical protein
MSSGPTKRARGNYIGEWFGYRVYPRANPAPEALATWRSETCPYLSRATGERRRCVKAEASIGVCSINTDTPLGRRDWLVCPYRAFDPTLLNEAVHRLFGVNRDANMLVIPAVRLADAKERTTVTDALRSGVGVYVYLDQKLGGEVSLRKTTKSPEFSIDVTILELKLDGDTPIVERFGALEIQTMDFHGSYQHAVKNMKDGLRLHPKDFANELDRNHGWMQERIEGPNLSNVFKRTFYQMAFKFQLGRGEGCAGTVLAIPKSVWESWRHQLGDPEFQRGDHMVLAKPSVPLPEHPLAWIFSFDLATSEGGGPDDVRFDEIIATSAEALSYWALEVAPVHAMEFALSEQGIPRSIKGLIARIWPELAKRVRIGSSG